MRLLMVVLLLLPFIAVAQQQEKFTLRIPVEYYTLDNGLRVVLSPDRTAPVVTVAVYYNIGFRIEPKNRTGFAHLFEHMMFQGSRNLGKMEFIKLVQSNGGVLNGSTRFDFTNYFEAVPSNKLETVLWAEADRMRGLAVTQENLDNQRGVVENEVKVNVLNQPFGGFPWLDMPQYANENWYNAHNFYGDLRDLDAATLEDVQSFFKTYYAPNNAVLVVTGDVDVAAAKKLVARYFTNIPSASHPEGVDLTEPPQQKEKRFEKVDSLANRYALAVAYHMPAKYTPEYWAMILLDEILVQGDDSKLFQTLAQEHGVTGNVEGGINPLLGNMFDYNGPMLWMAWLFHDKNVAADSVVHMIDSVITSLADGPIDRETLDRSLVKFRSQFYDMVSGSLGFQRASLLASFSLFDNDPGRINSVVSEVEKVTPELMQKTVHEYLRPTNRTVLSVVPKSGS